MSEKNTPTPPKQGVRARERNALERISGLEQDMVRVVQSVNGVVQELESKINTLSETLAAVVDELGPENVQKAIKAARIRQLEERAEAQKAALAKAIEEVRVVQIDKIEGEVKDLIITGVETLKDGSVLPPGYVQVPMQTVKPEFVEKLKDQGAGFKFETESGGSFEVTGVYKRLPPPEVEEGEDTPDDIEDSPAVEA